MRQHFDLYRSYRTCGRFRSAADGQSGQSSRDSRSAEPCINIFLSLEHIRHRGARQFGRNSDETYLRFSLLNSFSRNLVKCSLPTGSFKSSCKLNAHRRTRFNWISFLFNPTTSKMIKPLAKYNQGTNKIRQKPVITTG